MSNPYYTHQKYLREELDKLPKDKEIICLEFGLGDGSSSVFKEYLDSNKNLTVYAFESKYEWFGSMSSKYKHERYHFQFVSNWNDFMTRSKFDKNYNLVFIDSHPWESRILAIDTLKNKAPSFILHDYDFYNKGVIQDIFSVSEGSFFVNKFKDHFTYEPHFEILPPTLVLRK